MKSQWEISYTLILLKRKANSVVLRRVLENYGEKTTELDLRILKKVDLEIGKHEILSIN